jgi:hypothetical protein
MRFFYSKNQLVFIAIYVVIAFFISYLEFFLFLLFGIIIPVCIFGYLLWNHLRWLNIERLNQSLNINRYNAYIDSNGYLRWKDSKHLCHRDIAWAANLRGQGKFSELDIHHKDGNKFNNTPDNLELLSREAHQREHGQMITIDGKTYRKLAELNKVYHSTDRAYLVANTWIPKSQVEIRNGFIYIPEWMYNKNGFGN